MNSQTYWSICARYCAGCWVGRKRPYCVVTNKICLLFSRVVVTSRRNRHITRWFQDNLVYGRAIGRNSEEGVTDCSGLMLGYWDSDSTRNFRGLLHKYLVMSVNEDSDEQCKLLYVTYLVNNCGLHFFQISHGLISENGTKLWRNLLMIRNKNGRKPGQSMLFLLVLGSPTLFSSLLLYISKLKFHQYRLISTVTFFLEILAP